MTIEFRRSILGAMTAAVLASGPALAHHGWAWADEEISEIEGEIQSIYLGNPHASLEVLVDGEEWTVDLAPPRQTRNAGFTEEAAEVGDMVTVIGNRSRDPEERVIKAVRLVVGDETYDIYPERVPTN